VLRAAATSASSSIRFPSGTTDFSATGGASQVVRQSSAGAALTVGQLAASDLSNGVTGTGAVALAASPALTGTPSTPTAAVNTNTTQIASTAFVINQVAAATSGVASLNGLTGALTVGLAAPGGRLTPASGVCVPTSDVVAATTLYYAPCTNPYVPIYNGTNVQAYNFTSSTTDTVGLSLALGSNWAASTLHDVFVSLNGGNPVLCTVVWTSSVQGGSLRATSVAMYGGFLTNATTATCRTSNSTTISMAANQGTYLGTVFIASSGGAIDLRFGQTASGGGYALAGVWNAYNRTNGSFFVVDSNPSFTVTAANTYQAYDAGGVASGQNNRVYLVSGDGAGSISATMQTTIGNVASITGYIGIGLNVANAMWQRCATGYFGSFGGTTSNIPVTSQCSGYAPAGLNFLQAIQFAQSTAATFYGGSSPGVSGLSVNWSW
jgi:hypothetical protein